MVGDDLQQPVDVSVILLIIGLLSFMLRRNSSLLTVLTELRQNSSKETRLVLGHVFCDSLCSPKLLMQLRQMRYINFNFRVGLSNFYV
jgi:NADH:ubiquinone oxidoreductase subunit K